MIILGKWRNKPVSMSVKPNCITISLEEQSCSNVISFDYEGRPWTMMLNGVSYRRGLDGKTVAKWSISDVERDRRWISACESEKLAEYARMFAQSLLVDLQQKSVIFQQQPPPLAITGLENASTYTDEKRKIDYLRYKEIYRPVGILPPDQYGAVVLQATEGCSFNSCTFCTFYKDRVFKIKNPDEFREHCTSVIDFLGLGLSLRRTIFLGDANAIVIPMERLRTIFAITNEYFDVAALGGIYAFLDGVSGEKKSATDYAELASLGLDRVYIGLESGNPDLLKHLNKPSSPRDVVNTVQCIKQGGVSVGIILLLGAGGKMFAKDHIRDSVTAINEMSLDMNDIIYFSELIEVEGMEYVQNAYQQKWKPLTSKQRVRQGEIMQAGFQFSKTNGTPHISRYDIREFVY